MRTLAQTALLPAVALSLLLSLPGCASRGEALPVPQTDGGYPVPEGAVAAVHTEDNGDVVTEYRVQGQLRMVKVVPFRGPAYYLVDNDGDGKVDPLEGDAPVTYYKLFGW